MLTRHCSRANLSTAAMSRTLPTPDLRWPLDASAHVRPAPIPLSVFVLLCLLLLSPKRCDAQTPAARRPPANSVLPSLVLQAPHTQRLTSFDLTQDGSLLATGSLDHTIKVWQTKSHLLLRTLTDHSGIVSDVLLSPDGNTIASISDTTRTADGLPDYTVRLLPGERHSAEQMAARFPVRCLSDVSVAPSLTIQCKSFQR